MLPFAGRSVHACRHSSAPDIGEPGLVAGACWPRLLPCSWALSGISAGALNVSAQNEELGAGKEFSTCAMLKTPMAYGSLNRIHSGGH